MGSELKTLECNILNPDRLIWVSNVHTVTLLIFFLVLSFGYPYCIKVTFDNNYRCDAISIELKCN